jgi:hypothetical protein
MGVIDASWWGVWWPWMLLWTGTVAAMVVAATIMITHWRRHRKATAARGHGSAFYLNNDRIMDLYHQLNRNHGVTSRQDVEVTISKDQEAKIMARIAQSEAGGSHGMRREEHRRYTQEPPQPITVIGAVIDVLDAAGDIVNIELGEPAATPRRAIGKISPGKNVDRRSAVRLSDVPYPSLVSVYGTFRLASPNDSAPSFLAPYGSSTGHAGNTYVQVECPVQGLRDPNAVPPGRFRARCLGHVQDWKPQQGRLVLDPIAIFR